MERMRDGVRPRLSARLRTLGRRLGLWLAWRTFGRRLGLWLAWRTFGRRLGLWLGLP